jgi:hypothetical protein
VTSSTFIHLSLLLLIPRIHQVLFLDCRCRPTLQNKPHLWLHNTHQHAAKVPPSNRAETCCSHIGFSWPVIRIIPGSAKVVVNRCRTAGEGESSLRNVVSYMTNRMMDNIPKQNNCINILSSQTYDSINLLGLQGRSISCEVQENLQSWVEF